jgi:hypothetical protein
MSSHAAKREKYETLLKTGRVFTKIHIFGARKKLRRMWVSDCMSKIYWGSAKDRKFGDVKGQTLVCGLKTVQVLPDRLTLILVFEHRKIELLAESSQIAHMWSDALMWLIRRQGVNARNSVFKRRSLLHVTLPEDQLDKFRLIMKLLKGVAVTRYNRNQERKAGYLWVDFLLEKLNLGPDISARLEHKKSTKSVSIASIISVMRATSGEVFTTRDTVTGDHTHVNQLLTFSVLADNETSLDLSVASTTVRDDWCNGIDLIRQLSMVEKESFFWYYCNQKGERIHCTKIASLSRTKTEGKD